MMPTLHPTIVAVTARIQQRSQATRSQYLTHLQKQRSQNVARQSLSCTNLAHTFAGLVGSEKIMVKALQKPNIAIVSAYNEMLSAHQPFERFPKVIKAAAQAAGATAQFAGGVPAMCDGVIQGQPGMELSLFSRDIIAQAAAVALAHHAFDAALFLGVCDKIVPGLLIAALTFGHLPAIFVPAGPMASGIPNAEKARVRQLYAEGKIDRQALLEEEAKSYHSHGTCTFYGTANSNQMLMEIMGLHIPGSAFVHPDSPLRDALTEAATRQVLAITAQMNAYTPIGLIVDERVIVNGIIGLLATGGSTNHTIHLVAIARAAGIQIDWSDFAELSAVIPLLARIYPNGQADVNQFQAAGGTGFVIRELLQAGLLHQDVLTVLGKPGLEAYQQEPCWQNQQLAWREAPIASLDNDIVRISSNPFQADGGIRLLQGNLGRAIFKASAVKLEHRIVEAPAIVFEEQEDLLAAFQRGELDRDFVAVVRFQGPQANGMPELHQLTPTLAVLQDRGYKVALVTDGRMSGASGKVPAAIHVSPEALIGGPLAKVQTGDLLRIDAEQGILMALIDAEVWRQRVAAKPNRMELHHWGYGRELFANARKSVTSAETGATLW